MEVQGGNAAWLRVVTGKKITEGMATKSKTRFVYRLYVSVTTGHGLMLL